MKLSDHFTLEEFESSATAKRLGLDNSVPKFIIPKLIKTALGMEEVRALLLNKPIHLTSGYRSPEVNRAVGSKPTSQHITGNACDFICPLYGSPKAIVERIVASDISYDQVILERSTSGSTWVHISFSDRNRKQALSIDGQVTREFA
jgi:hypothetical protein